MNASEIVKFSPVWWKALGERLCGAIRERVQSKHTNVNNQAFQGYTEQYAIRKAKGKARTKGKSQQSYSTVPDMTLTGQTMSSLQVRRVTATEVVFGWLGVAAEKIQWLFDTKNYQVINLTGEPLAQSENKIVMDEFNRALDTNIKKYCQTPINITVRL